MILFTISVDYPCQRQSDPKFVISQPKHSIPLKYTQKSLHRGYVTRNIVHSSINQSIYLKIEYDVIPSSSSPQREDHKTRCSGYFQWQPCWLQLLSRNSVTAQSSLANLSLVLPSLKKIIVVTHKGERGVGRCIEGDGRLSVYTVGLCSVRYTQKPPLIGRWG